MNKQEKTEEYDIFVGEMRYRDYVIEFFWNKQAGKYYWQASYDGEESRLGNFNIWLTVRGISLYSEDDKGYPTKAEAVAKAKEWVNKQKRRWGDSDQVLEESNLRPLPKSKLKVSKGVEDYTVNPRIGDNWSAYTFKTGIRSDAFKQYLRDRGIYFEPSQDGEYIHFEVKNADESVDRRAEEIVGLEDYAEDYVEDYVEDIWAMNEVLTYMNNEEAYYGTGWLYIFEDGCSYDELKDYLSGEYGDPDDLYQDYLEEFEYIYNYYHEDGLYDAPRRVEEYANTWDKKLGLEPIENIKRIKLNR